MLTVGVVCYRYKFQDKIHKVESEQPQFTRLADRPGLFEIVSVSHKKAQQVSKVVGDSIIEQVSRLPCLFFRLQCKAQISNMSSKIYPLPVARIEEGNAWLREGTSLTVTLAEKYKERIHQLSPCLGRLGDRAEIRFEFEGTPPFSL